jgi:hypothetical protein
VSWTLLSIYHLPLGLRAYRYDSDVSISGTPHRLDQTTLHHGVPGWDAALNGQSPNDLAVNPLSKPLASHFEINKTDFDRPARRHRTLQ